MPKDPATYLYDYNRCDGETALQETLRIINSCGYALVGVTQYEHTYTIFFRRPIDG